MDRTTVDRLHQRLNGLEELRDQWRQAGLAAFLRGSVHAHITAITTEKDGVVASRGDIAARTKAFAQLPQEEREKTFPALIKGYQQHVDVVTRALKLCDGAFSDLAQYLSALPDPLPALDKYLKEKSVWSDALDAALAHAAASSQAKTAATSSSTSSDEAARLRAIIQEREAELAELQNQEVTVQQLKEALAAAEMTAQATKQALDVESASVVASLQHHFEEQERAGQHERYVLSQELRRQQLANSDLLRQLQQLQGRMQQALDDHERDTERSEAEVQQLTIDLQVARKELLQLMASSSQANHADGTPSQSRGRLPAELFSPWDDATTVGSAVPATPPAAVAPSAALPSSPTSTMPPTTVTSDPTALASAMSDLQRLEDKLVEQQKECLVHQHAAQEAQRQVQGLSLQLSSAQAEAVALRARIAQLDVAEGELRRAVLSLERELTDERKRDVSSALRRAAADEATSSALTQIVAGTPDGGDSAVPNQTGGSSSAAAFAAITQQRDRYRQRILTLEEASSREIEGLQSQLQALRADHQQLLAVLSGEGHGGAGASHASSVVAMPSMMASGSSSSGTLSGDELKKHDSFLAHQSSGLRALYDRTVRAMSWYIFVRAPRRFVAVYVLALHVVLFLNLVWDVW